MTKTLTGRRILIVEDDYFIASDLKRMLTRAEAKVVGPVGDIAAGLALIEREPLDAAILDVNLDGVPSYPLADRLAAAGVPHAFVTGYDGWSLPDDYRETPRITKPFASGGVTRLVQQLCAGQANG